MDADRLGFRVKQHHFLEHTMASVRAVVRGLTLPTALQKGPEALAIGLKYHMGEKVDCRKGIEELYGVGHWG